MRRISGAARERTGFTLIEQTVTGDSDRHSAEDLFRSVLSL